MELQPISNPLRPLKTRIAPTPSGYLHMGNILSFAITWALAREQNGTIALRIDDLDSTRFREEYLHDIFETLHFLGIDYDEGPEDACDFLKNYSQRKHLPFYNTMLQKLTEQNAVYACPCSRTQIAGRIQEGNYPFTCRYKGYSLDLHEAAWRLRIPEDAVISFDDILLHSCHIKLNDHIPDFIVMRKDGVPAYQIASLCDDLRMGINLIVRGEDLLPSTAAQLYLALVLNERSFTETRFLHHPVLYDTEGRKLSKSHDSLSIKKMRSNGSDAGFIWRQVAGHLNIPQHDITDSKSFLAAFSLQELITGNSINQSLR